MMRRAWQQTKHNYVRKAQTIIDATPSQDCITGVNQAIHSKPTCTPIAREAGAQSKNWRHVAVGATGGALLAGIVALVLNPPLPTNASTSPEDSRSNRLVVPFDANRKSPAWLAALSSQPDVFTAFRIDQESPHQGAMSADHWFSSLVKDDHIHEIFMLYNPEVKRFFSVFAMGKNICGYPGIVHGGLTAAAFDETFGGLLFALKSQRQLPFWGPAFTAQLDITYISRIPPNSTILCTADVESIDGRKVWMRGVMSDGPEGKVYATARALFVAPKPHRLLRDVAKLITPPSWLGGSSVSVSS